MERDIRGVLRGVHGQSGLPILVSLRRFPHTDAADLGVVGLEAGQQTDVAMLLVTLAVAIHLGQPVCDLRGLGVNRYGGWIRELRGGEHRCIPTRHRPRRRGHARHLRHWIRGGGLLRCGGFLVLTAGGGQKSGG